MNRVRCSVPHCRRTRPDDGLPEWICADHWSAIPEQRRRAYLRAKRAKVTAQWPEALARLWRRLVSIAIERAGGL